MLLVVWPCICQIPTTIMMIFTMFLYKADKQTSQQLKEELLPFFQWYVQLKNYFLFLIWWNTFNILITDFFFQSSSHAAFIYCPSLLFKKSRMSSTNWLSCAVGLKEFMLKGDKASSGYCKSTQQSEMHPLSNHFICQFKANHESWVFPNGGRERWRMEKRR